MLGVDWPIHNVSRLPVETGWICQSKGGSSNTDLLDFGVFKELQDKDYFQRVKVRHGTVVWPHEQDICPDTLYVKSPKMPTVKYTAQVSVTHYRRVEFELP